MAKAETRLVDVQSKRDSIAAQAGSAYELAEAIAASELQKHRQMIRLPAYVTQTDRLRGKITVVQKARRHLSANPALAWGGMLMVLAVVIAMDTTKQALESEFGPGPFPSLVAMTDIWGIGLR